MGINQFNTYAKFYDLLYKDKNYQKEAEYIHGLIIRHSKKAPKDISILDLACGTGKHLFELSTFGYGSLSGSDISASMIDIAKEKVLQNNKPVKFYNYSFQDSNKINTKSDVVISMFSAVNYLTNFKDQLKTFNNIYNLLNDNGIVIFDYWNGNAVIRDYSPVKVIRKKDGEEEILRISTTDVNTITQSVAVKFNCMYFEKNNLINEFEEIHNLHYYHFSEMYNLLDVAGFDVLHISPFLEPDNQIKSHDWNISIVARKKLQEP